MSLSEPRSPQPRSAQPSPAAGWADFVGGARPAVLALFLGLLLALPLERLYRNELNEDLRTETAAAGTALGNALSGALSHRMALVNGLRAFVEINYDRPGFRPDFMAFASRLHGSISGIRTVQWIQDGVIQQSFPEQGNEASIGYDLLSDSRAFIRDDYRRTELADHVVISGPTELVQGGTGLIARMAVRTTEERLLAVVAVVLDLPPLLREAGVDGMTTLRLAIRSAEAGVFEGDPGVFDADPVLAAVPLAEGEWELAVVPAGGWAGTVRADLVVARVLLGLLVLLMALSAWLASSRAQARAHEEAERQRRRGEEKFERLFALSPDAAFVARISDGVVLEANDGVAAALGTSRESVVGQTISALMDLVTSGDWSNAIHAVSEQGSVRSFPIQFRTPNGQLRHGLYSGRTIDLDGEPCVLSLLQDVTDQRRLEEQLAHAQKLEAVGRLAGGVAHDFNNVITAISGYAQLLSGSLPPEDPRRADADEIHKAATRAARLTQQLLAFARRQIVQPRVSDLNRLIHEVTRLLRRLLGGQVELVLDLTSDPVAVSLDPGQFEQVLVNLALNARDAMPAGGEIVIGTRLQADQVVLTVSDQGEGMSEEVRAMIFEPFFTTKERGRGTGLGLATVYGIVEQSGGSIDVASRPGEGSTFTIRLPRSTAALDPEGTSPNQVGSPGGSGRILLAEDEPQVRRLSERTLTAAGYEVVAAADGTEAVRLLAEAVRPFDLLVTDLLMPGLGGHELAQRFRVGNPAGAVLFISGYTDDDATRKGLLDAGQNFLPKPFTPNELASRVRDVLESVSRPGA